MRSPGSAGFFGADLGGSTLEDEVEVGVLGGTTDDETEVVALVVLWKK